MAQRYPRVEVEWWDVEDDPEWQSFDEAVKGRCPLCYTTGRLLSVCHGIMVIATTVNCDDCGVTRIPVGCVKNVYRLQRDGMYKGWR